jgi:hypothetical protein
MRLDSQRLGNRSAFACGLLVASLSLAFGLIACSVGDQICTEDFDAYDLDDDCPYGPPGGPRSNGPPGGPQLADICPTITPLPPDQCNNAPTWDADIFPMFKGPLACTLGGCHGPPSPQAGLLLPEDSSATTFKNMTVFTGSIDRLYIDPNDASQSWILCNLEGKVGSSMPPPNGVDPANLKIIERWAGCGLSGPDDGASGGTGGTGGAGGAGGS